MKAGDGPTKSRSRATTTAKRRQAPKAARVSSSAKKNGESPAQTEAERLALELQEARERQAATAEVLSLISDSPTGIQPVFDRIVKNAARLCQSVLSAVYRRDGDHVHLVAYDQFSPESVAAVRKAYPAPLTSKNLISVAIRERRVVHEPDVLVSGGYSELQSTSGYRSILIVPMLRDDAAIGAIAVISNCCRPSPARRSSPVDTANCRERRAIAASSSCRCCATRSRSAPSRSCGLSRNYFPRRRSNS